MNFERIDFNREHFSRSLDFESVADLMPDLISGNAKVYRVERSHFILRKEGGECVLVAYEGENSREVFGEIVRRAAELGFHTIRFHVNNPAIARIVRRFNPRLREYVYEVSTHGRQVTQ